MTSLLSIRDLSKRFGGVTAVNRVSVEVESGSIHGVIGPNGAGKTTLFNMIAGVLRPTEGQVFYDGADVTGSPPYAMARRRVGRTFQLIELFAEFSVLENVAAGFHVSGRSGVLDAILGTPRQRRESRVAVERARESIRYVGLIAPESAPARGLSYGHRRLLEIARALMLEPKLLLLDEPAAGLNASERVHLGELIRRLRQSGVTVLVIEHHMDLIMSICDTISVLSQGYKVSEGPPSAIQADPAVIEAYLGVQDDAASPRG
jgi:ABC-type branched-subunit amino acid transport system ATPase component